MASRIAHDIRSPMGVIMGVLDELDMTQPPKPSMLALARRSAGKLDWIARRMDWLAMAIAAPDKPLLADTMPIDHMIRMAAKNASVVGARRAVALSVIGDTSGPDIAHGSSFRHVCEELLINALRHAKSKVELRLELELETGNGARVSVEDDGGGIATDRLESLYATSSSPRGAIGLWLAQRLATRAGGQVHHEAGAQGARFVVDVPLLRSDPQT